MLNRFRVASRSMVIMPQRQFSLLVPITPTPRPSAEHFEFPISEKFFRELEEKYAAFNEACKAELQMMNQNIITDIMDRGGHDGWETQESLDYMSKSFDFNSFEEANTFVQHVSKFCNQKDHHPEWSVYNGGRTVNVKLTSHFANNKVTRLDFELAEAMNNSYFLTNGRFKRGGFTEQTWSTVRILVGSAVALSFLFRFFMAPKGRLVHYDKQEIPEAKMDFSKAVGHNTQLYAEKFSRDNLYSYGTVKLAEEAKSEATI